jgi:Concanavalin A-like lectin/glucanases superfamily
MSLFTPTAFYQQIFAAAPAPPAADVVTNGLILYFDTTNAACYPGSGTSVFNLVAGQPITGSLVNSVTYKDGYLQFNGTNQYMDVPTTSLNYVTGTSTVMGASRYADTTGNGRVISTGGVATSNWLLGHFGNTTLNYYPGNTILLNNGPNDTNWRIYTGTANTSTDRWDFYVNGVNSVTSSTAGSTGPFGFNIARNQNNTEYSSGSLAILMLYNRVLSPAEVTQNYDALKGKVGLT